MRYGGGLTTGRIVLYLAGAVLLVLVLAQVLLPRIAASMVRSRVARYGRVTSVSVSAWPAIKLLWGSVDSVRVQAAALALSPAQLAALLGEATDVANVDVDVARVRLGPLALSDAKLTKRGPHLSGQASATETDVSKALPAGVSVALLRSEAGEVEVRVGGSLFGVGASTDAVALASEGKLVVKPVGLLLGALQLTLFSEPHVYIEGAGVSEQSAHPLTYRLQASASLR